MMRLYVSAVVLFTLVAWGHAADGALSIAVRIDPVTRYAWIEYAVPKDVPEEIQVRCSYRTSDDAAWQPVAVKRYRSHAAETAIQEMGIITNELSTGQVTETLAAGRRRTLIWQNHLQLPAGKRHDVNIQLELSDPSGKVIATDSIAATIDLSDVAVLTEDMIYKRLPMQAPDGKPGWVWRHDLPGSPAQGMLDCNEQVGRLDPLVFRPMLRGRYAVHVAVPGAPTSEVELRLGSDLFSQRFPGDANREYLLKIAPMDGEHVIASQSWRTIESPSSINDEFRARLTQVRFVPVSNELYDELTALDNLPRDKHVHAYFEIYSWAYLDFIDRNSLGLEAIAAFSEAGVDAVDAQLGRFGAKPQYPSVIEEALIGNAIGDAPPGGSPPDNANVGLLALYTDCWRSVALAGRAMDLPVFANFGAGNAYPSYPLQGNFAKNHPQWVSQDGQWVQYKYKEVRAYALSMYREILDRGAKRLSLDFCRYPYVVDHSLTATTFLQELRALADEYSTPDDRVEILVRFPVPGVKGGDRFDPRPWIEQRLIDYLSPSTVAHNASFADVSRYIAMTRGTGIKCIPAIDLLPGGPLWTEGVIQWADHLYDLGADGVYLYQADSRIVGNMQFKAAIGCRPLIARLGSSAAVKAMHQHYQREQQNMSTDIYIYYGEPYTTYRPKVWIEGGTVEAIEYLLNGKPIDGRQHPPYQFGTEGYKGNFEIMTAAEFTVRAKINGTWITRTATFDVHPDYNN